jgi:hypothetical protein
MRKRNLHRKTEEK